MLAGGILAAAAAAPGDLDPSFGGGGIVRHAVPDTNGAMGVAVQPDGKLVASTRIDLVGLSRLALTRYNPNGSIDTSFGGGDGVADFDAGGLAEIVVGPLIQADGKMVVGATVIATAAPPTVSLRLLRINPNGSLDTTFGTGGILELPIAGFSPSAVHTDPSGRIVLGGGLFQETSTTIILERFLADGASDPSFTGGAAAAFSDDTYLYLRDIVTTTGGKLVVVGSAEALDGTFKLGVSRLNGNGTRDTTFASSGSMLVTPADVGGGAVTRVEGGEVADTAGRRDLGYDRARHNQCREGRRHRLWPRRCRCDRRREGQ